MSYWRRATRPARALRAVHLQRLQERDARLHHAPSTAASAFAQQLVRAKLGAERIGWDQPHDDLVLLPEGGHRGRLPARARGHGCETPVLMPTWGWPDKNVAGRSRRRTKISHLDARLAARLALAVEPILDHAARRRAPARRSNRSQLERRRRSMPAVQGSPDPLDAYQRRRPPPARARDAAATRGRSCSAATSASCASSAGTAC